MEGSPKARSNFLAQIFLRQGQIFLPNFQISSFLRKPGFQISASSVSGRERGYTANYGPLTHQPGHMTGRTYTCEYCRYQFSLITKSIVVLFKASLLEKSSRSYYLKFLKEKSQILHLILRSVRFSMELFRPLPTFFATTT